MPDAKLRSHPRKVQARSKNVSTSVLPRPRLVGNPPRGLSAPDTPGADKYGPAPVHEPTLPGMRAPSGLRSLPKQAKEESSLVGLSRQVEHTFKREKSSSLMPPGAPPLPKSRGRSAVPALPRRQEPWASSPSEHHEHILPHEDGPPRKRPGRRWIARGLLVGALLGLALSTYVSQVPEVGRLSWFETAQSAARHRTATPSDPKANMVIQAASPSASSRVTSSLEDYDAPGASAAAPDQVSQAGVPPLTAEMLAAPAAAAEVAQMGTPSKSKRRAVHRRALKRKVHKAPAEPTSDGYERLP